jgi:hypothetical protein
MTAKYIKWLDASPEMRARHIMKVYSNGQGWTTTPPTVEGWYWAKIKPSKDTLDFTPDRYCVYVRHDVDAWEAWCIPFEYNLSLNYFTHWLGPLPLPEPPT